MFVCLLFFFVHLFVCLLFVNVFLKPASAQLCFLCRPVSLSVEVKVCYLGLVSLSLSFLDTLERHQADFDRGLSGQRSLSERDINDICKLTTNNLSSASVYKT